MGIKQQFERLNEPSCPDWSVYNWTECSNE